MISGREQIVLCPPRQLCRPDWWQRQWSQLSRECCTCGFDVMTRFLRRDYSDSGAIAVSFVRTRFIVLVSQQDPRSAFFIFVGVCHSTAWHAPIDRQVGKAWLRPLALWQTELRWEGHPCSNTAVPTWLEFPLRYEATCTG